MRIKPFENEFTVCKTKNITAKDLAAEFCFVGKTDSELSLVCETKNVPENTTERSDGWRAFRVEGELDFALTGILARIAGILADRKIPIFAVSTYNTDYILVKEEYFSAALSALADNGYEVGA